MEIQEKDQQILRTILSYIDGIHRTHVSFRNDRDAFLSNPDYQYSVAFALLQVGELTGRLEMDIPNKASIKALRNRIVHGYGTVNQEVLWEASHQPVKDLRYAIEALLGV